MTTHSPVGPAQLSVRPMGDAAFTVVFDGWPDSVGARRINALCETILRQRRPGDMPGLLDLIPASRSLTVCFDPEETGFETLSADILARAAADDGEGDAAARSWRLPACYEPDHAPDLAGVAAAAGLDVDGVVALHAGAVFTVLLIGFLPGFPFLGPLDRRLWLPRRATPRMRVPAGSVAIANDRSAIYPWDSPGGWWLIARCPVPLFSPDWPTPGLLRPGDRVRFEPVSAARIRRLDADLQSGAITAEDFRDDGEPG